MELVVSMTADERNARIRGYFENECMSILEAKGHDYAGDADCLANLRRFGLFGIIVRLSDKFSRIETLAKAGFDRAKVKDESIRDTLRDIVNYSLLAMIFLDEDEKAKPMDTARKPVGLRERLTNSGAYVFDARVSAISRNMSADTMELMTNAREIGKNFADHEPVTVALFPRKK